MQGVGHGQGCRAGDVAGTATQRLAVSGPAGVSWEEAGPLGRAAPRAGADGSDVTGSIRASTFWGSSVGRTMQTGPERLKVCLFRPFLKQVDI